MAKKERKTRKKEAQPKGGKKGRQEFYNLTRRVLLAGVGAAALAYDEVGAFVDRLVERGELAQEQARELLQEVRERREGRLQEMGEQVRERLGQALESFDVPRRADLEALQQRLDQLTERVGALLQQKETQD